MGRLSSPAYKSQLQQDASTGQMIFSPAEALAFITQFVTVESGDMINMGTPAGVVHQGNRILI